MDPDLKQTILDLETSYWNAMTRKDGAAAAKLCGETSIVANSHGVSSISADRMGELTKDSSWSLDSFSFSDVQVVAPTPDIAIIGYVARQEVTVEGKTKTFSAADCSTWVRGQNGWLCHSHSEAALSKVS